MYYVLCFFFLFFTLKGFLNNNYRFNVFDLRLIDLVGKLIYKTCTPIAYDIYQNQTSSQTGVLRKCAMISNPFHKVQSKYNILYNSSVMLCGRGRHCLTLTEHF